MYATLGNLSIGKITKVDLAEASKSIWIEKDETTRHIRGRISQQAISLL